MTSICFGFHVSKNCKICSKILISYKIIALIKEYLF